MSWLGWMTDLFAEPVRTVPVNMIHQNVLPWQPLDYLIRTDIVPRGQTDRIIEVGYDINTKPLVGQSIAYCNLFDEHNTGEYGPYLKTSDTAQQYNEGQIDPSGAGWRRNLEVQFKRRRAAGFEYVELDNPDAYRWQDVIGAIDLAASFGLRVIAKNAYLIEGGTAAYLAHQNVFGCIVERGCGMPVRYDQARHRAGKSAMPVWFVFFGDRRAAANSTAKQIADKGLKNMSVTYSAIGEYGSSTDVEA